MLDEAPTDKQTESKAVAKLLFAFDASQDARSKREEKWLRWYGLYHSYVEAEDRSEDNWRSKVFVPATFYVVETVAPRLVAQLPRPTVYPVGEEDVQGAAMMEAAIGWAAEVSELYIQLVAAMKDALTYGTGILKTFADEKQALEIRREEVMEDLVLPVPVIDPETGQPLRDPDGNPLMEETVIGQRPTGRYRTVSSPYTYYRGPFAEAVDIFNFFVSPEASSVDDARWVIHRTYLSRAEFERLVSRGVYRKPEYMSEGDIYAAVDDPRFRRYASIGMDGRPSDPNFDGVEILEFWTDDRRVALVNRRFIGAAEPNPFIHQEKPFIRLVDHYVPHEFWGIGEVQVMEGLQDYINSIVNSRADAVRLALNMMFLVDEDALVDPRDLRARPGGKIRVRNRYGLPLEQIIKRLDFGQVAPEAYAEVERALRELEKVTGVSAYQLGTDAPYLNRTATGVVTISEQAASRFAHKLKMMELTGLKRLFKHYGLLLQQFTDEPMARRVLGQDGSLTWQTITPESIQGRFDYQIEAESSAVTESVRREQALMLRASLAGSPYVKLRALDEDVLRAHGKKDIMRYLWTDEQLMQMQARSTEVP